MNFSFGMFFPELIILYFAFFILVLDLFLSKKNENESVTPKTWVPLCALFGIVLAALAGVLQSPANLELFFKEILLLATGLVIMISPAAVEQKSKQQILNLPEFFAVLLFTLSGMMFLVSSRDLVSLYVSLELATVPLFALTAWSKTDRSGEAGIKYLIIGALGSAFLLYGFGFLYGLSGNMSLMELQNTLKHLAPNSNFILFLASALITAGVGFKLTLFPFHMWAPDAYQGAPTPMTAFLSVASKATGLILAIQLFFKIFGTYLQPWALGIAIFATLTMSLGNLVAIRQNNLKRFMAYSSISQAGYLILGFLTTKPEGLSAMVFYMLVYILTNLAAFGVLIIHIHQTGQEEMTSLKGLSRTNPLLALAFMIALFGLAGIPPLAGFVGKFFLFSIAAQGGYYWLVAVAAINSTVSLYYYLRIVRQMYIESPAPDAVVLKSSPMSTLGLGIATLGSVVVGLVPFIFEGLQSISAQWLLEWMK